MFSFTAYKQDAQKIVEFFSGDLSSIRAGRAKPSLVENIVVEAYGSMMKIMELATITASDATTIVIKPWDKSVLKDIEKAISLSDLHIPPVVDSDQIRLHIPPLTGERRQELIKVVSQKKHQTEDMIRDVRVKYKKQIEGQKGQPGISEDNIAHDLEQLQKFTDEYIKKIDEHAKAKEAELQQL